MTNSLDLFSVSLVLFLIMDPIGNIPSYLTVLKDHSARKQKLVIFREMLFALIAMLVFNFIGEYLFDILHVSETTVRLSSGLILFLIALGILFPTLNSIRCNLKRCEPFIIPLAIPLIAGPSLLATIMLYAHLVPQVHVMLCAILSAWTVALLVLLAGPSLRRYLGDNGLLAAEKLMGMVLIMLAIQRFMEGVHLFAQNY